MQRIPSVSVVIPNYNGKHLLEENLPSIITALTSTNAEYQIIVSDDASKDGSLQYINESYPQIKTIRSEINYGFSHTVNQGLTLATKTLVLLLNSDIKLKEDYFSSQWKYFERPDTFGVMGSIWSEDRKHLMDAAKYPIWKGGQLRTTINYQPEEKTKDCLTLFLSGANALVDREKLMALHGMDEQYSPYYMEDVDLSVRAWRSGWKCYYEKEAICYHKLSETISKHSPKKHVNHISKRNKFIFHHTHLSGPKRLLWNAENIVNILFRWLLLDRGYYKSYFEYKKLVSGRETKKYPKTLEEITQEIIDSDKSSGKKLF
jgi:GT2 family glycosyltransferase